MQSSLHQYNRSSTSHIRILWRTILNAEHLRYRISTPEKLSLRKRIERNFYPDSRRIRPRPFDRQEHAVEDRFPRSAENLSAPWVLFAAPQSTASDRRTYLPDLRRPIPSDGVGSLRCPRIALSLHCPDSRIPGHQKFRPDSPASFIDNH